MARTDDITHFLTDVAAAIKTKKGSSVDIPASDFDTEILALPLAGTYQTKTLNITQNGNYSINPDEGYDAIEQLTIAVSVPISPNLQNITVTQNGTYKAGQGYDGIDTVVVDVDIPTYISQEKEVNITSNQTLTITPDEGYDGLSQVLAMVRVPGGGGDDPAVNNMLWYILGFDQIIFNALKYTLDTDSSLQFTEVGGTTTELRDVLTEILEGGTE